MVVGLFKDVSFGPLRNLHTCISLAEFYRIGQCLGWRFSPMSIFSSLLPRFSTRLAMRHTRVFVLGSQATPTGLLKNASFGLPHNLHTCISLVEFYRFGQCMGWRLSPMLIFFSPAFLCTFSDEAHSRFWCQDPKWFLLGLLKMLVLALPLIYTSFKDASFGRLSNLHTCISLVNSLSICNVLGLEILAHVNCLISRVFLRCRDPKQCFIGLFKDASLSPVQIYARVFHFWNSI